MAASTSTDRLIGDFTEAYLFFTQESQRWLVSGQDKPERLVRYATIVQPPCYTSSTAHPVEQFFAAFNATVLSSLREPQRFIRTSVSLGSHRGRLEDAGMWPCPRASEMFDQGSRSPTPTRSCGDNASMPSCNSSETEFGPTTPPIFMQKRRKEEETAKSRILQDVERGQVMRLQGLITKPQRRKTKGVVNRSGCEERQYNTAVQHWSTGTGRTRSMKKGINKSATVGSLYHRRGISQSSGPGVLRRSKRLAEQNPSRLKRLARG